MIGTVPPRHLKVNWREHGRKPDSVLIIKSCCEIGVSPGLAGGTLREGPAASTGCRQDGLLVSAASIVFQILE